MAAAPLRKRSAGPGLWRGVPLPERQASPTVSPTRARPPRGDGDPQWALLDRMSEDEVLDALGPAWSEMTHAQRRNYGPHGAA